MDETKKQRREQAREHARANREQAKRRQRRKRWFLQGGIGAGILAAAGVTLLRHVGESSGPCGEDPVEHHRGRYRVSRRGRHGHPDGVERHDDGRADDVEAAKVDLYIDWSCPVCKQFETATSADLTTLIESEQATSPCTRSPSSTGPTSAPVLVPCSERRRVASLMTTPRRRSSTCRRRCTTTSRRRVSAGSPPPHPRTRARRRRDRYALDSCIQDETFKGWVQQKYTAKALSDKALDKPVHRRVRHPDGAHQREAVERRPRLHPIRRGRRPTDRRLERPVPAKTGHGPFRAYRYGEDEPSSPPFDSLGEPLAPPLPASPPSPSRSQPSSPSPAAPPAAGRSRPAPPRPPQRRRQRRRRPDHHHR